MAKGEFIRLALGRKEQPRIEARERLAAAVERKKAVDDKIAAYRASASALAQRQWRAEEAVEAAQAQLEANSLARNAHVVDPTSPAPAMSLRDAREAIEEAEAAVNALRDGRQHALAAIPAMETEAKWAGAAVEAAITDVLAESKVVRGLCERVLEAAQFVADHRGAVSFLLARGAVPDDLREALSHDAIPSGSEEVTWRALIGAMKSDASAPLPGDGK